jgi:hypothetical protein
MMNVEIMGGKGTMLKEWEKRWKNIGRTGRIKGISEVSRRDEEMSEISEELEWSKESRKCCGDRDGELGIRKH